jgi:TRAP-type C4-dicarboxylate transport system permease small subunit
MKKATTLLFQIVFLTLFLLFLYFCIDIIDAKTLGITHSPTFQIRSTSSIMALCLIFMILSLLGLFMIGGAKSGSNELSEDYDRITQ